MQRICNAGLMLDGHPKAKEMMRRLVKGHLRILKHGVSVAKNALWELEVWARAKRGGRKCGFS